MPCYDARDDKNSPFYEPPYAGTTQEKLDKIAAMLCVMCQYFESFMIPLPNKEIETWWSKHKKSDEKRVKAEIERLKLEDEKLKAISKLSPYERKLLGL